MIAKINTTCFGLLSDDGSESLAQCILYAGSRLPIVSENPFKAAILEVRRGDGTTALVDAANVTIQKGEGQ